MAVDREFDYIIWRPAFATDALSLHLNLGAASLEKRCVVASWLSESVILLGCSKVQARNLRSAERSNTMGVIQNDSPS